MGRKSKTGRSPSHTQSIVSSTLSRSKTAGKLDGSKPVSRPSAGGVPDSLHMELKIGRLCAAMLFGKLSEHGQGSKCALEVILSWNRRIIRGEAE